MQHKKDHGSTIYSRKKWEKITFVIFLGQKFIHLQRGLLNKDKSNESARKECQNGDGNNQKQTGDDLLSGHVGDILIFGQKMCLKFQKNLLNGFF